MFRSAVGKVTWMARATTTVVGLAIMLALVFGVASTALGKNGQALILGKGNNVATKVTGLIGKVASGPALMVKNPKGGSALGLQVNAGQAPLTVNAEAGKAANLNADKLDDKEASDFYAAGSKVADSDKLNGKDFSAFGTAEVIDSIGPLPVEGTYTSKGGTLFISAAGSGYRGTATHGRMGMRLIVDGLVRGAPQVFTNERNSHKAFVEEYAVVRGLPAGQHTIRLEAIYDSSCTQMGETENAYCTTTNEHDHFRVTVLEIPT